MFGGFWFPIVAGDCHSDGGVNVFDFAEFDECVTVHARELAQVGGPEPPAIVKDAGKPALFAYAEFFGAQVENDHTRAAYGSAADRFFQWCDEQGLSRVPTRKGDAAVAYAMDTMIHDGGIFLHGYGYDVFR